MSSPVKRSPVKRGRPRSLGSDLDPSLSIEERKRILNSIYCRRKRNRRLGRDPDYHSGIPKLDLFIDPSLSKEDQKRVRHIAYSRRHRNKLKGKNINDIGEIILKPYKSYNRKKSSDGSSQSLATMSGSLDGHQETSPGAPTSGHHETFPGALDLSVSSLGLKYCVVKRPWQDPPFSVISYCDKKVIFYIIGPSKRCGPSKE